MNEFIAIGIVLVIGVVGAKIINRLKLPSVVGWLVVGAILGQSGFRLFTPEILQRLGFISDVTLGLVGFVIGAQITIGSIRKLGGGVITTLLIQFFSAYIFVFCGVWLLTRDLVLALLLGALATATAPAGTVTVLQEYKARGPLTKALFIIVGVDDALAVIVYVFTVSYVKILLGGPGLSMPLMIGKPLFEVALAIAVGGALGWLFGILTRRIRSPEVLLVTGFGTILICIGLSKALNFSLILSTVVLGALIVNLFPKVSRRLSSTLQLFIPPFYVCFFALAGAHLDLSLLLKMGILGAVYVVCRSFGKLGGGWLGASLGRLMPDKRKYLGLGLLSQAGVAIGLAYLVVRELAPLGVAGQRISSIVLTVIAATTIVFEIVGPIFTKLAITKAGEANIGI